jgi:hypothetical protein
MPLPLLLLPVSLLPSLLLVGASVGDTVDTAVGISVGGGVGHASLASLSMTAVESPKALELTYAVLLKPHTLVKPVSKKA